MFQWLPGLDDDEDEEEDDGEVKAIKAKRGAPARTSRGLRNKPLMDKKLMKQREGKLKDRRAKKAGDDVIKDKKGRGETEEPDEAGDDEENEESVSRKSKRLEEQKKKKKTQKGWVNLFTNSLSRQLSIELISWGFC